MMELKTFEHECNVVNSDLVVAWSSKNVTIGEKNEEQRKDSTTFVRHGITPHLSHAECSEQGGRKTGYDFSPGAQISIFNKVWKN